MQAVQLTARRNESLDALLWRALGVTSGVTEAVLQANPGLADIAQALPEGYVVDVPAPAQAATPANRELVQLWT